MTTFKKFVGNYIQVMDALEIPAAFYSSQGKDEYIIDVSKDIQRTPYASHEHEVPEIKKRLSDTTHLKNDPEFSYSQGNFDAGVFKLHVTSAKKHLDAAQEASEEQTKGDHFYDDIRMAYIDDEGNYCGLTIVYQRIDKTPEEQVIPIEERKHYFTIAHIKHTNKMTTEREVTYFSHPHFVTPKVMKDNLDSEIAYVTDIEDSAIPQAIDNIVNSEFISSLLVDLFEGEHINIEKFDSLAARVFTNHNIDNRDFKKLKMLELIDFAKNNLPDFEKISLTLDSIEQKSKNDFSFYKEEEFKLHLEEIISLINQHIPNEDIKKKFNLTCKAIHLELYRESPITVSEEERLEKAFFMTQAKIIRSLRDNPKLDLPLKFDPNKDIDYFISIAKFTPNEQQAAAHKIFHKLLACSRDNLGERDTPEAKHFELYLDLMSYESQSNDFYKTDFFKIFANISEVTEKFIRSSTIPEKIEEKILYYRLTTQNAALDYLRTAPKEEILKLLPNVEPQHLDAYQKLLQQETLRLRGQDSIGDVSNRRSIENIEDFVSLVLKKTWSILEQDIEQEKKLNNLDNSLQKLIKLPSLQNSELGHIRAALVEERTVIQKMKNKLGPENEEYVKLSFPDLVSKILEDTLSKEKKELAKATAQEISDSSPKDNFFVRNRNSLIAGTVGLFTFIGLVLILTGVLAPFGIVLEAIGVTLAVAGSTAAGAVVLGAAINIATDEIIEPLTIKTAIELKSEAQLIRLEEKYPNDAQFIMGEITNLENTAPTKEISQIADLEKITSPSNKVSEVETLVASIDKDLSHTNDIRTPQSTTKEEQQQAQVIVPDIKV